MRETNKNAYEGATKACHRARPAESFVKPLRSSNRQSQPRWLLFSTGKTTTPWCSSPCRPSSALGRLPPPLPAAPLVQVLTIAHRMPPPALPTALDAPSQVYAALQPPPACQRHAVQGPSPLWQYRWVCRWRWDKQWGFGALQTSPHGTRAWTSLLGLPPCGLSPLCVFIIELP